MRRFRHSSPPILIAVALTVPLTLPGKLAAQHAPTAALDVAGMDRAVKPGDNFFAYANGTWLKQTEIPADRSTYGASAILIDQTDRRVADLIQEAAKGNAPAGSDLRKIGDYYTSFMDTTAIDAAGLTPLQPTLDSIAAIRDRKDLARVLGSGLRADVDAINNTNFYTENLFGLWVAQDMDDPTHYSPFLLQGGLGMPDRSYYVDSSASMATIRAKYQEHMRPCSGWRTSPAILQPPYFDPARPLSMDYGAMGAIIGHEVSHSFDNQGALFDAAGRLYNWWTPEDFKHFEGSSPSS